MTRSWTVRPMIGWTFASAMMVYAAISSPPAAAQFVQQGPKLVDNSNTISEQGNAVALSRDGNTAAVGVFADSTNGPSAGAVLIFIRSGNAWTQQGAKLLANDETGGGEFGSSVSLSADGNTLLVGGSSDNNSVGAAWIFTRSGTSWTQQGSKLVGSGYTGSPSQGVSVALSADGNTAIVGGNTDNAIVGGAWVFTRSGNSWSQQGSELVGSGYSGQPLQGSSVAISADGNTAILGGPGDNSGIGGAWVFTRSGNTWSQQGSELVADDSSGNPQLGYSAALSADGNTALLGGVDDNTNVGAAWVFSRSGNTWSQQGPKLIGSGYDDSGGFVYQGYAVALSGDGNTALVGAYSDASQLGAVWLFSRTGGTWGQLGGKLVGSGYDNSGGSVHQGSSVALSGDGNTAIEGGIGDGGFTGAAWIFLRSLPTNSDDFSDDGVSDILWLDNSGDLAMWLMSGGQLSSGATLGNVGASWSVAGIRDFNGDGSADLLWLDQRGDLGVWLMNGTVASSAIGLGNVGTWKAVGTGDFNGDGTGDILWRNGSGDLAIWLMSNGQFSSGVSLGQVTTNWSVAGTGDFNGDGTTDILWRNTSTGELAIWFMSNGQVASAVDFANVSLIWSVAGTGDFDGDGTSDILWRDTSGDMAIWRISNGQLSSGATIAGGVPATWSVAAIGDFDGDGKSDILWIDQSGDLGVWLMNGLTVSSYNGLGNVGTSWHVQGQNAD